MSEIVSFVNRPEVVTALLTFLLAVVSFATVVVRNVGSVLAGAITRYVEAKVGTEEMLKLKSWATTVVRALAQSPVFEKLTGAEKKELAIIQMMQFAERMKIDLSYEQADRFIEEAVQVMKSEQPNFMAGILEAVE